MNFWLLEPRRKAKMAVTTAKFERITCPAGHVRPRHPKIGKLSVELPSRSLGDFEWTWDSDILISEQAVRALERNNVTGFETRPVEARYRSHSGGEPPALFELAITGWGGMAAPAAGVRLTDQCRPCRHREYTIADPTRVIDPAAWDGSDLFMVWPLPRFRFASNRFAEILQREHLSGVHLLPAADLPVVPGDRLGPGPLDVWMPEGRAREIGRRFDVL